VIVHSAAIAIPTARLLSPAMDGLETMAAASVHLCATAIRHCAPVKGPGARA